MMMKNIFGKLFLFILIISGLSACNGGDGSGKNEKRNIENYEKVAKAFETGDVSKIDELVAPGMIEHTPEVYGDTSKGPELIKRYIQANLAAFPDFKMKIEQIWAKDDVVIAHLRFTGTNTGPLMGGDPTGKSVDVTG